MTDAPKLLTEAELEKAYAEGYGALSDLMFSNGLIAPAPVDPLLIEARSVAARCKRDIVGVSTVVDQILAGKWDDHQLVVCALAALKRGMELAASPLTREMVREALRAQLRFDIIDYDALHAALTAQVQA